MFHGVIHNNTGTVFFETRCISIVNETIETDFFVKLVGSTFHNDFRVETVFNSLVGCNDVTGLNGHCYLLF